MAAPVWLINAASGLSVRLVRLLARSVPGRWRNRLGERLGSIAYRVLPSRRKVAIENIRFALADGLGPGDAERIARSTFRNLGKTVVEFCNLDRMCSDDLSQFVRLEGEEHLTDALAKGRGVVYLTAHFGNWELMGAAVCQRGYKLSVIARDQRDPIAHRAFEQMRESVGMTVLEETTSVRAAIRALRRNELLGILADQNTGRGAVFVPFFGRDAATAPGTAVLAMRTGAAVIPAHIVRNPDDTHTVHIEAEIRLDSSGDFDADVLANTRKFSARLEEWIRAHPDHWLWLHKRWKSRPQRGQAGGRSFAASA